jgi:hypothetical protein
VRLEVFTALKIHAVMYGYWCFISTQKVLVTGYQTLWCHNLHHSMNIPSCEKLRTKVTEIRLGGGEKKN